MHSKPRVRLGIARFWRGATADQLIELLLQDLVPYFDFEVSAHPRLVLYGPYRGRMPAGHYTRVFIGCENVFPIMNECDWAFGVAADEVVNHPRYMRLARWGSDENLALREKDWRTVLRSKTRFCAFVYSNKCPYREAFFDALARYKRVDSPGRARNNMPSIDAVPGEKNWHTKIEFLRHYKFVIAFENSSLPGYHTEKLIHAIEADSIPVYWGDPEIGKSYNAKRFINAHDHVRKPTIEMGRLPFYRPHSLAARPTPGVAARAAERVNRMLGDLEQALWSRAGFSELVAQIIRVDNDDELYVRCLREPFLIGNRPPDRSRWIARWHEILSTVAEQ